MSPLQLLGTVIKKMSAGIEQNYRFKVNLLLIKVNFADILGILIILSMKATTLLKKLSVLNSIFELQMSISNQLNHVLSLLFKIVFTFSFSIVFVRFAPSLTVGFHTSCNKEAENL